MWILRTLGVKEILPYKFHAQFYNLIKGCFYLFSLGYPQNHIL